jgi:hypothetical protein
MSEHEVVYSGEPKTIYESRCSCGWTCERYTPHEASEALFVHRNDALTAADR